MLSRDCEKKIFLSILLFLVFFIESAVAADVAYVYRNDRKIDENVLNAFEEMSLSVDLVDERNLPRDFSAYKFIFIGDERISSAKKLPVGEVPAVVMNRYYGNAFGLTDRGGISLIMSSAPLRVRYEGRSVQVYDSAHDSRKVSIPYYYISWRNKAGSLAEQAQVVRSSRRDSGDVVSYVSPGAMLENREIAEKGICFFGIVASDYWTPAAEGMFKDCVNFVLEKTAVCDSDLDCDDGDASTVDICLNAGTNSAMCESSATDFCESDSDCGIDSYLGAGFCSNGNVKRQFRTFTCNSPGTASSYCSSSQEEVVVENCAGGCTNGACVQQSGLVHDVALVNVTNVAGMLRIQNTEGEDILYNESLQCNEKYKVIVRVKNLGNFTENISFSGAAGALVIEHGDVIDLEPDKTSDRTKTVNFTLPEGFYNLTVEAKLSSFADSNLLDNFARREIRVVCGISSGCSSATECGTDGFVGGSYCSNGNVAKLYRTFSCDGACSHVDEEQIVESCNSGCNEGSCVGVSALKHDVALVNVTNTVGIVRIKDSVSGEDILDNVLGCNKKYQFIIRAKNLGNYTENVSFVGNLGNLAIEHSAVAALEAGKTSDRTKTVNVSLPAGNYQMNFEAILNGFVDVNEADNSASKQVTVVC